VQGGGAEWGDNAGAAVANLAMRILSAVWNHAMSQDATLPANPVSTGLKRQMFAVPRRERLLRGDELPTFHQAVMNLNNPVARDYILFLLFTGLRREEAASLTWADVDVSGGVVRLPASRTKANRKLDLPVTDVVREILETRRAPGKATHVFPSNGGRGYIRDAKFILRQIAMTSGISISAHDLRRTYITVAAGTEIPPIALKALVNHSLGNDVTAGYIQITAKDLLPAAQKVCDRIKQLCGIVEPSDAKVTKLATAKEVAA
jgi:integrase